MDNVDCATHAAPAIRITGLITNRKIQQPRIPSGIIGSHLQNGIETTLLWLEQVLVGGLSRPTLFSANPCPLWEQQERAGLEIEESREDVAAVIAAN